MKRIKGAIAVLILFVVLIAVGSYYQKMLEEHWKWKKYQESSKGLNNPDRGFYIQADVKDTYAYEPGFETQLRLRLLTMDLYEFQETAYLPEEKLNQLKTALEAYRELGITVIFRAGYFFGEEEYTQPSQFETILNHCRQICPILNEYKDVVQVVQAGFIGPYGEWHNSPYLEKTGESQRSCKIELLDCLNQELHEEISIALRRPMFIREAERNGVDTSRFAIHNDALFSTDTDMGTYVEEGYDRQAELKWMHDNVQSVMNGGEMTNISPYTQIENAMAEMDQINISYLNGYYNKEVLTDWKFTEYMGQNACSYIENHLGYRLFLEQSEILSEINHLLQLKVKGIIKNTGFAMPQDKYQWYLVISSDGEKRYYLLQTTEQENEVRVSGQADIWQDFPDADSLQVGICITRDENRSEHFSIELANDEVNYENGINWFLKYDKNENDVWMAGEK